MADTNLEKLIGQLQKADMKKLSETLKAVAENATNAEKSAAAFLGNLQKGVKEQKALAEAMATGYGSLVDSENRATEAANTRVAALKLVQGSIDQQNVANQQILANLHKIKEQNDLSLKSSHESTKVIQKNLDLRNKELDTAKKLTPAIADAQKQTEGWYDKLLKGSKKISAAGADLLGHTVRGATSLATGALEAVGLEKLAKQLGVLGGTLAILKTEAGQGFLTMVANGFEKTNNAVSDAAAAVGQFTGGVIKGDVAAQNLGGRLIGMAKSTRMLGGTVKALAESMKGMTTASRTFGMLMGANRKRNLRMVDDLTEMAFVFDKVGMNTENFGKALDVIGKTYRRSNVIGLGKSLGAEMVNIGRVTGQTADAVAADFDMAMKNLAAYSLPKARAEFKKLSAIAAVTGVAMNEVMTVATKFDDIESTAEAVGQLNAMMGGPYLNTLDLVNATESERIEMLKEMMTQSGETFNTMDRFKQKAIAEAIGMDVQGASRLFMGSQKDIDSTAKSIDSQGASFKQLERSATKSATSITEQQTAIKEAMMTTNKVFNKTDTLMRNVNKQMAKFGDLAKEQIEGIAGKVLDKMNTKLNRLKRGLTGFASTGNMGDIGEQNLANMALWMAGGTKGAATYMSLDAMTDAAEKRADAAHTNYAEASGPIQANPETPKVIAAQEAATKAMEKTTEAQTSAWADVSSKIDGWFEELIKGETAQKPIQVSLNVDGDEIARKVLDPQGRGA